MPEIVQATPIGFAGSGRVDSNGIDFGVLQIYDEPLLFRRIDALLGATVDSQAKFGRFLPHIGNDDQYVSLSCTGSLSLRPRERCLPRKVCEVRRPADQSIQPERRC
jgi:hypothetical protein